MEGAWRVWHRQRTVWWMFAVNAVLAFFSTLPLSLRLDENINHSLASQRLVNGFDLGTFSELTSNPDVAFGSAWIESFPAILVFFVFVLFLTGGVLAAYSADHKLSTREFFRACGAYIWRLTRLFVFMLIVAIPVFILCHALIRWCGTLINDAAGEKTGYWVLLAVVLLTLFLSMTVRLWFDMAQVRAVIEDERAMRWTFVRSFRLTFSNFGSLFWLYFRISFLAWVGLAVGLWLWARISGHSGLSIVMLEVVLLWWIGTRLWQRASETVWYQRRAAVAVENVAPVTPLAPVPELAPSSFGPPPTNG